MANVLKSLGLSRSFTWFGGLYFSCVKQLQQPQFCPAPLNAQDMTAVVCMMDLEQQLSMGAAASDSPRQPGGCCQPEHREPPVLQISLDLPGRW